MVIKPLKFKDIPDAIISEDEKIRLIFPEKDNANYFGGFIDDDLVCLTCLVINKNRTGSIKSNYTIPEHRKKGYFAELNRHCLKYAKEQGVERILLNCLEDSKGVHLKQGARIWKTTKTIYWMIYDEGTF